MADEAQGQGAAIFGDNAAPTGAEGTGSASGSADPASAAGSGDQSQQPESKPAPASGGAAPPAGKPEWLPDQFWAADANDPTKGTVLTETMAKAFRDNRAEVTRAQQRVAELSKTPANLPAKPDEYWAAADYEAVKKAAPNVTSWGSLEEVGGASLPYRCP